MATMTPLLFSGYMALSVRETIAEEASSFEPSPLLYRWYEQRVLHNAIRDSNKYKNQIYLVFDENKSSCSNIDYQSFSFANLYFDKNGVYFIENGGDLHYSLSFNSSEPGQKGRLGLNFSNCKMELHIEKFHLVDRIWQEQFPISFASITDWSKREISSGWNKLKNTDENFSFLFETQLDEHCPSGGGQVFLFPNALISDFGKGLSNQVHHLGKFKGRDIFSIGTQSCEYLMSVSNVYLDGQNKEVSNEISDLSSLEIRGTPPIGSEYLMRRASGED